MMIEQEAHKLDDTQNVQIQLLWYGYALIFMQAIVFFKVISYLHTLSLVCYNKQWSYAPPQNNLKLLFLSMVRSLYPWLDYEAGTSIYIGLFYCLGEISSRQKYFGKLYYAHHAPGEVKRGVIVRVVVSLLQVVCKGRAVLVRRHRVFCHFRTNITLRQLKLRTAYDFNNKRLYSVFFNRRKICIKVYKFTFYVICICKNLWGCCGTWAQ